LNSKFYVHDIKIASEMLTPMRRDG